MPNEEEDSPSEDEGMTIDLGTLEPMEFETTPFIKGSTTLTHTFTQRLIALITAVAFFTYIGVPLSFLFAGKISVEETVELVKTLSAVLGGIVGLVWGFYFHKSE